MSAGGDDSSPSDSGEGSLNKYFVKDSPNNSFGTGRPSALKKTPMHADESLDFMKAMNFQLSKSDYDDLKSEWEYQGFDPLVTHGEMMKKGKTGNRDTGAVVQDINHLMVFYALRGTKISKSLKRMKDTGKDRLEKLRDRYQIRDTRPSDKKVLTVGRIAATYPGIAVQVFHQKEVPGIVPESSLNMYTSDGVQYNLPCALRTPVAVSMIPKTATNMVKAAFKYNLAFSAVVNKGKVDKETQKQFFLAALNSPSYTEAERLAFWKGLRVIDAGAYDMEVGSYVGPNDENPLQ